jgi:hypothetical protein
MEQTRRVGKLWFCENSETPKIQQSMDPEQLSDAKGKHCAMDLQFNYLQCIM